MIKIKYKGVDIEEKLNIPKTGVYFEAYLDWHDDPTVRKVNIITPDLDSCKAEVDSRLEEIEYINNTNHETKQHE
tara:strand:- start:4474 stop:4698 length:225 start_codon:yes stop_codon:yes gene_type:complete